MNPPANGLSGKIIAYYSIGIPAKSGVSGAIFAIIPNFGCISIYSPPLDVIGNSVRGVDFFKRAVIL
jgi:glutaminase